MRFQLPTQLKTRQGDTEKDARIKNGYVEIHGQLGKVRKRPGVNDLGIIEAGVAQLLACWNGPLSVIEDSLSELTIVNESVVSTPIDTLSPVTPNLSLVATSTGAAQSQQQLFLKSTDQAWIYIPE